MRSLPKLNSMRQKLNSGGSDGLYISMIVSLRQAQQVMGSAHSLFVGGFSILGPAKVISFLNKENFSCLIACTCK